MNERKIRNNKKTMSIVEMNFHCRLHCLEFIRFTHGGIGVISLSFKFTDNEWNYRGLYNDDSFDEDPVVKISDRRLFRFIYGYFREDRTRTIFSIDKNVKLDFSVEGDGGDGVPGIRFIPLEIGKYVPFGTSRIDFRFSCEDNSFINFDFSGIKKNVRNITARGLTSIPNFLKDLRESKISLDTLNCTSMQNYLMASKVEDYEYILNNTSRVEIFPCYADFSSIDLIKKTEADDKNKIFKCTYLTLRTDLRGLNSSKTIPSEPVFWYRLRNLRRLEATGHQFSSSGDLCNFFQLIRQHTPILRNLELTDIKFRNNEVRTNRNPLFIILNENKILEEFRVGCNKSILSDSLEFKNDTLQKISFELQPVTTVNNNTNNNNNSSSNAENNINNRMNHFLQMMGLLRDGDGGDDDDTEPAPFDFPSDYSTKFIEKCEKLHSLELISNERGSTTLIGDLVETLPSRIESISFLFPRSKFSSETILKMNKETVKSLHITSKSPIIVAKIIFKHFENNNLEELMIQDKSPFKMVIGGVDRGVSDEYKLQPRHLEGLERNFTNKLRRFGFDGVNGSLIYFVKYSSKLQNVEFATNSIGNYRRGVEVEEGFCRSSDRLECLHYSSESKEDRIRRYDARIENDMKHVFRLELMRKRKQSSEEKYEISEEEQEEYLQKSINKWGLLAPYEKSPELVNWKRYYEMRLEVERKGTGGEEYNYEDQDFGPNDKAKEIKETVKSILEKYFPDSDFSEDTKKLILRSVYVQSLDASYPNDAINTLFYSIYGDGRRYEFDFQRRYKHRRLFNEFFENYHLHHFGSLFNRTMEDNSNFCNYYVVSLEEMKFLSYLIFRKEEVELRFLGGVMRLFASFTGHETKGVQDMMENSWMWVKREVNRVWGYHDKKNKNFMFFEGSEIEDRDFSDCVIDNVLGVEGHGELGF